MASDNVLEQLLRVLDDISYSSKEKADKSLFNATVTERVLNTGEFK